MNLIDAYHAAIARNDIVADPLQLDVLAQLQQLADELNATERYSWLKFWKKKYVSGIYLYGPVGVGKTYLSDLFYQYVDEEKKVRLHFHQFMQQVDAQLRQLQGQKDPLLTIAANVAKTTRLLCFDEFFVYDVADAMILAELLQALIAKGVVLVATSNIRPDDLYLNGIQRARFLPVIALIKKHCQVIALEEQCDYRLGRSPLHKAYIFPLNDATTRTMKQQFATIARNKIEGGEEITIQNRPIACVEYSDHAVWFRFDIICNLPRCQLDYLEIADRFDTVFVSDIPILTTRNIAQVVLFIHFIDVMYDRGIQLIISAEGPVDELYPTGPMQKDFQRTLSRLQEMQSEDYIRRHQRRSVKPL